MEIAKTFWFLGSIYSNNKTDKFTVSIYSNHQVVSKSKKRKFYRHVLKDDYIVDFQEVNVEAKIHFYREIFPVVRGDLAVFCYTNKKNELFCGNRHELEKKIIPLLSSKNLNMHGKLTISSFLKFHGRTYDLISEYEKELSKNDLYFKINVGDFIYTKKEDNLINPQKVLTKLFKRQKLLNKYSAQLFISDLALLQNTHVYFDDFCINIEMIIGHENPSYKRKLNDLIDFSIRSNRVELGISFKQSKILLAYVVRSPIDIEQKKIERLLSQKAIDIDKSVIEIGAKVDEQLEKNSWKKKTTEDVQDIENKIQELDDDVQKILNQMI